MLKPIELPVLVAKEPREVIDNSEIVNAFRKIGGTVLHLAPMRRCTGKSYTRGMTAAFVVKSGRIQIATSIQHRNDVFTRKLGTRTAIEHFNAGKTIDLPLASKDLIVFTLKRALNLLT